MEESLRLFQKINSNHLTIHRNELNSGIYLLKLSFDKGESFSKIVLK
ncbi:MAG: T9SS type A sorting domain-containing protein [Saprospiraceae bacterium]|nr:T9SS type A sorting domain-containing protein [Saprospiraceae bacterium]